MATNEKKSYSEERKKRNQSERNRIFRLDDEFQNSLALLRPVKRARNVSRDEILEKLIDQYVEDFPDVQKNTEVDNGFRMRRTLSIDEQPVVIKRELETLEDENPFAKGKLSPKKEIKDIGEEANEKIIKREGIVPKVEEPVSVELFPVLSQSIDYILGLPTFPDTLQVNFDKLTPINQCRRQKWLPDNLGGHPIKNQDDYYVIMMGFLPKTLFVTTLGKNKLLLNVITHYLRLLHKNDFLQFRILDKKHKAPREVKILTIMKEILPVSHQPENDSKDEIFCSFIQYLLELQPGPHSDNNYRVAREIRHQGINQKVIVKSGETFQDSLGILLIKMDLMKSAEEFERTHNTNSYTIPSNNFIHIE